MECCKLGYVENHYEKADELTAKELYYKYADGRDEGLSEVTEDSTEELFWMYLSRYSCSLQRITRNFKLAKWQDFFVRTKDYLVPVEVKATSGMAKSLRTLIKGNSYPNIKYGIKFT